MRKAGFVLFLLGCVVVVVSLWQEAGSGKSTMRRGFAPPPQPETPEATVAGLAIEDGVAQAPAYEEALPDDAPAATRAPRFWAGRAVSAATRRGVTGATVVLESLSDPPETWAQPATGHGGFFTLRAPAAALEGEKELRVVVESSANEVGLKALPVREEPVIDLGTVLLSGRSALGGRAVDEHGAPAPDVRLTLRRLGELEVRPGVVAGATTDERGEFRLQRLPRGSFVLAGNGPEGRRYLAVPVLVPAERELVVAPLPAAELTVALRDALHEPVAGAVVEAIPHDVDPRKDPLDPALFATPSFATTDSDGVVRFPFLMPRTYTLFLTLPDDARFEFVHAHARAATRRLVVPADPRIRVMLVEAPERGPAPRPMQVLKGTPVRFTLTGRTSMPERVYRTSLSTVTDGEGIAILPRPGTTVVHVEAYAPEVQRRGAAPIRLAGYREGIDHRWVAMRPAPPPEEERPEVPRRARVTLPDGTPVQGARVYVRRKVETGASGEAELGPATEGERARLSRPGFASGDPDAGEFGRRALVELTWNEGEVVTVRVSDGVNGFPLTSRVRIHPRPSAWRVVEPGLFRARWDLAYADPESEIVVRAPGYEEWRAPGGPGEFDARLQRPLAPTATLALEVRSRNAPLPGVQVTGRLNARWQTEAGRREFVALTGAQGRVDVPDLAEGPWTIRAYGPAGRSVHKSFTLARGRNPLPLLLGGGPLVRGVVVDDRRQPVAGVRIERVVKERRYRTRRDLPLTTYSVHPRLPAVHTDRRGGFGLALPHDRREYLFTAKAPGYETTQFRVTARPHKKPPVVTLPRLASMALPLAWHGGSRSPVPDDIVMSIARRSPKNKRNWIDTGITAHVVEGRLQAAGLPPGRLRFTAVRGSAWAPVFSVNAKPGRVVTKPAVPLRPGGTLEGVVTDRGTPVVSFAVYVGTRPVRTDEQGRFRVTGLAPRTYAIHAEGQTEESRLKNRAVRASDGFVGKVTVRIIRDPGPGR